MKKSSRHQLKYTQHSVAKQMEVSQRTLCRKSKVITKHTNTIKPTVNENNKLHRLSFALFKCEYDERNDSFKFKPHTNVVYIDEKHFYLTRKKRTYYLAPDEVEPHRECQSKRFIPKIMFMCANANPIFSTNVGGIQQGTLQVNGRVDISTTSQMPEQ